MPPSSFSQPDAGARQPVGGRDVVHQEAIDVLERRLLIDVGRQQVGVPRLGAAVAADVEVVALLRGDQAEVLALGLGALADAAGDGHLDLVRRADALVAVLDANGEADGVLHAVAAPGRADAALHGAQRLAVGVAAFEAGVDQLLPDVGQVLHLGAEQIDPLAAGDLRVQAVLLGDLAQHDQLLGRDLAAGDARHDGIQPAALHVGQEAIVGVLQRLMLRIEHVLVPQARQDRGDRRLADLAASAAAVAVAITSSNVRDAA